MDGVKVSESNCRGGNMESASFHLIPLASKHRKIILAARPVIHMNHLGTRGLIRSRFELQNSRRSPVHVVPSVHMHGCVQRGDPESMKGR